MECLRKHHNIPIYIVEDHDEVVPIYHREIATKHLPFHGLALVHFDSHPDLLIPLTMPADTVFDKFELYLSQSIENWIMPQVYAGHLTDIYWLKPPWASQIPEREIKFLVGKCQKTGRIRTTCKENYFVSEGLYCPESLLTDAKEVTLTVIGVVPEDWENIESRSSSPETSSQEKCPNGASCLSSKEEDKADFEQCELGSLQSGCVNNCAMNDVQTDKSVSHSAMYPEHAPKSDSDPAEIRSGTSDANLCSSSCQTDPRSSDSKSASKPPGEGLECVSNNCSAVVVETKPKTENRPCSPKTETVEKSNSSVSVDDKQQDTEMRTWRKAMLDKMVEQLRGRDYILDIDLDFFSTKNPFRNLFSAKQMELLRGLFSFLPPADASEQAITECVTRRQRQLEELEGIFRALGKDSECSWRHSGEKEQLLLEELVAELKSSSGEATVDWELVHNTGCTIDDSELPHHISSSAQVLSLGLQVKSLLQHLPRPRVISLARSSSDDYCPAEQVDFIQEVTVSMLEEVYLYTTAHYYYQRSHQGAAEEQQDGAAEGEEEQEEEEMEEEEEEEEDAEDEETDTKDQKDVEEEEGKVEENQ